MQCEDAMVLLDELVHNELEPRVRSRVRSHIGDCRVCRDWAEELRTLAGMAPQLMGESPISFLNAVLDHYAPLETTKDRLWVAWSSRGVRTITRDEEGEEGFRERYDATIGRPLEPGRLPAIYQEQIERALEGRGPADPSVDLGTVSPFERRVLETLPQIPVGEVRSYAWVAREIGNPRAVRAVGNACAHNPVPFLVPCHRVVPSAGGLGRYALGPELKQTLLSREGVDLPTLEILHREGVRYVGSRTAAYYCFPTCRGVRQIAVEDRVLLRDDREALARGLEPCSRCRPLAYRAA